MHGSPQRPPTMKLEHWLVLALTAIAFGSSFPLNKIAVAEIPPLSVAAWRSAAAAVVLWTYLRFRDGGLPPLDRIWRPFLLIGILGAAIPFVAIAWGQLHIQSALGGILFATIPMFTVILSPVITRVDRFSGIGLIGAAIGFVGVALAVGIDSLTTIGAQSLGAAVTLMAALCYACSGMYARRRGDITPRQMAAGQQIVGALCLLPVALTIDGLPVVSASSGAIWSVVGLGLTGTALPVVLIFWLIRHAGATAGSLVTLFIPFVTVAIGTTLLGEALPPRALAGLVLVVAGAAVVSWGHQLVQRLRSG